MTILDGVLQSDGVLVADPQYVQELHRLNKAAGGLWCADEVQGGHGRSGTGLWSFSRFEIEPDFVTMGKPMGNGHPCAAVVRMMKTSSRYRISSSASSSSLSPNQI
jgi:4-aminobutyrate aminotransferase-like enzyme